jgi:hypothetical protein
MKIEFEVGDEVKYPLKYVDLNTQKKIKNMTGRPDRIFLWGKIIAINDGPLTQTIYFESKDGTLVKDISDFFFPAWQNSTSIPNSLIYDYKYNKDGNRKTYRVSRNGNEIFD